jgi:GTPase SAR1 family protein
VENYLINYIQFKTKLGVRIDLENQDLIKAIVYSVFDDEGPQPVAVIPKEMEYTEQLLISMKSISLLMGEQVYQEGREFDTVKYFGILPFPDLKLTGLTYFFLLYDETARGKAKAATFSILVDDTKQNFLYDQMKPLSVLMAKTAEKCMEDIKYQNSKQYLEELRKEVLTFIESTNRPIESKRVIKLVFTGLDASGKTSYLKAVKQKFSELLNIKPTKGIDRNEISLLGTSMVEWDVGGQRKYRENFLRDADLYIYDTNLLFFLIDIRDTERFEEAYQFLNEILNLLRSFKQFPPIIVNFHKVDPDIAESVEIQARVKELSDKISREGVGFKIVFFQTSIFNQYSLNKAFSEGIGLISPNREIFKSQLKWFANQVNARCVLLLNENSLILSDYSQDETIGKITEMSAPHFQILYRTFFDFKLLRQNSAIWQYETEAIVFYKWSVNDIPLYLLLVMEYNPKILELIEQYLEEFSNRTQSLIMTYL